MYKKQRIEALSDGIFAIAMTLLVLNLKVPTGFAHGHVWAAVASEWETWLSYALTFGLAARFWTLQHELFDVIDNINRSALIATFFFLGLVSVLPYTTSLLGQHFSDPSVLSLYCTHECAVALALIVTLELCKTQGHIRADADLWPFRLRLYSMCISLSIIAACAPFIPMRWIAAIPILIGAAGRVIRHKQLQKT